MITMQKKKWHEPEMRALAAAFARFLFVGGIVFITHSFFLWFFLRQMLMGRVISLSIAYGFSVCVHFSLNNFFVFRKSHARYKARIIGYLIVLGLNYCIATFLGAFILKYVLDNIIFATVITTGITTVYSFFVFNKFVFKTAR